MTGPLRALVVDDEEPARQRILDLLATQVGWEIAGTAQDGAAAVETIRAKSPDLVFLDVQMPEMTGFEVIRAVGLQNMPSVVFVTAYDQYALQAFETCALDYLMKPFTDARFQQALQRSEDAIRRAQLEQLHSRMVDLLQLVDATGGGAAGHRSEAPARIAVQGRDRTLLLPVADIDYVTADGPYMQLHVDGREFLIRERMHTLAERLAQEGFQRIHRSTLVNIDRVVAIEPYFRGEAFVQLRTGDKLKVSRSRRPALYAALGLTPPRINNE